jgi:hypothetical protein
MILPVAEQPEGKLLRAEWHAVVDGLAAKPPTLGGGYTNLRQHMRNRLSPERLAAVDADIDAAFPKQNPDPDAPTGAGALSHNVAQNIRALREARQLSYAELARRLDAAGHPIPVLGLRRIENLQRRVDVDDLAALAHSLDVPEPWTLTGPPACDRCHGAPPAGFTCNTCGTGATP